MYKVVLVDDERWSLEGLDASFQWEKMGFQVIGKFTDSLEAFSFIREEKPDVVFTDIRMPDMTGLELIEKIKDDQPNIEFIIVSGYAEFDYARQAMKEGAYDYLLKPIDTDETAEFLDRLKKLLDHKKFTADELLLQRILYEDVEEPILECLKEAGRIQVVCIADWNEQQFSDACLLAPFYQTKKVYCEMIPNGTRKILLYDAMGEEEESRWIEHLNFITEGRAYIGISSIDTRENLRILLKEAVLASSGKFVGKKAGVTRYSEIMAPYYETYGRRICQAVAENHYEEACEILNDVMKLVKCDELGIFYIVRLWNQIAILLHENLSDGRRVKIEYLDFINITRRFSTLEVLVQYIKIEIAEILITQKEQVDTKKDYNENFMKLLSYVEDHYTEKLSLNMLSEQFFLNMTYCSELFKKVVGTNFSDYVTKLRMEKAADLLATGKYKIKEVAELTGYSDSFYFSKVWKKYYGVTPAYFLQKKE